MKCDTVLLPESPSNTADGSLPFSQGLKNADQSAQSGGHDADGVVEVRDEDVSHEDVSKLAQPEGASKSGKKREAGVAGLPSISQQTAGSSLNN